MIVREYGGRQASSGRVMRIASRVMESYYRSAGEVETDVVQRILKTFAERFTPETTVQLGQNEYEYGFKTEAEAKAFLEYLKEKKKGNKAVVKGCKLKAKDPTCVMVKLKDVFIVT